MPIHDISLPISEGLAVWPGDPAVHITQPAHLDRGDAYTVSRLDLGAHTGTHVDAPAHFIAGGAGVDDLDLQVLVGPAWVVHARQAGALSAEILAGLAIPPGVERLLFRTRNSERWARGEQAFFPGFVGITPDGAQWLIDRGVRLVGVDYLSVASLADIVATHQVLLRAAVVLVEGLDLSRIDAGAYRLVCLPLKIAGGDGAPARAILISEQPPGRAIPAFHRVLASTGQTAPSMA
jgi:arylformamidase